MAAAAWKIGELARRTGLTVRALHHYDRLALVRPSARTPGGHRVYTVRDLARLQQVLSLRDMGFGLAEIGRLLRRRDVSPIAVLRSHAERLREAARLHQQLCERLEKIVEALEARRAVDTDDVLWVLQVTNMNKTYLTPEQMADLEARGAKLGDTHIREVEAEWPRLIAAVRGEMQKGTDPASEPVQQLARRWVELVKEFTGGDPGIGQAVAKMYANEPAVRQRTGIDSDLMAYVAKAMKAGALKWTND